MKYWQLLAIVLPTLIAGITLGDKLAEWNPVATKSFVIVADERIQSGILAEIKVLSDDVKDDNTKEAAAALDSVYYNICKGVATPRSQRLIEKHLATFKKNSDGREHGYANMLKIQICPIAINNVENR